MMRSSWFRNTQLLYKRKIEYLTLCDSELSRPLYVVDLHGVGFQNGLAFCILRAKVTINHVPHARKFFFFILVFFRELRDLTLTLTRT